MPKLLYGSFYSAVKTLANHLPLVKTSKTIASATNSALKQSGCAETQYRLSTPPSAIPLLKIIKALPTMFPLSWEKSLRDYEQFNRDAKKFQTELFSTLPFYPNPANRITSEFIETHVGGDAYINEFCVRPTFAKKTTTGKPQKHLILVHGYGAGMGFFIKNIEHLARNLIQDNWCIHAIDLPGYGYSSRDKFPFKIHSDTPEHVEEWFHAKIHQWFRARGLLKNPDQNTVLAHSMGAYLMATYAAQPSLQNHWSKLIMCSPGGITPTKLQPNPPLWFVKLWDQNISPFSIVRTLKRFGSKITSAWTFRRFSNLGNSRLKLLLHRYTYAIFNAKGSGEYMLSFFLKCGGDPRFPLQKRFFTNADNNNIHIPNILRNTKMEWIWLYGQNDWMNVDGGIACSKFLNAHDIKSKVAEIPNAGHHLYLDNEQIFNEFVLKELKK
ncbi:hypothetical protein ACO0RG_003477 [Hanseniaspora osmophila]